MIEPRYWDDLVEGQEFTLLEEMDTQRLVIWAAASHDFRQIHYDESFAKSDALPDILVHGALKCMLIGRILDEIGGPGGWVKTWGVSYRGMDIARVDITVFAKVTKKYEAGGEYLADFEVGTRKQDGTVTTPGTATLRLAKR